MTLDEFLLARIAEDEARVDGVYQGEGDPDFFWGPQRIGAECEAKRRIVEGIVPERDPYHDHPDYDAEWVLKDLASVYADHPDYLEEWRP